MTGDEMADRLLKGIVYEREQAKVAERARIRSAVEGLYTDAGLIDREAVLAAIDALDAEPKPSNT